MKKKIYLFLPIFIISLLSTSCEDDINLSAQQSLDVSGAFLNEDATLSTLQGVYSSCQLLEMSGGMPQIFSDFMSDNSSFVGSFPTFQEIRDYVTLSTNTNIQGVWQQHYRVIARANDVIANVPNVPGATFTAAERAQFIAESKFLRALGHFQLVNLFAQPFNFTNGGTHLGIPLVTESFTGTVNFQGRNTVSEVYNSVIKDLTDAVNDLPATYSTAILTRGRATKGAAQALLSRVYLYKGDYTNAAVFSKQVLDASATYAIASSYAFYTSKNTSEDVFTIQNSSIDNGRTGTGGWASWHRPAANGGRGDIKFSPSLIAAYTQEAGDLRYVLRSSGTGADANPATFSTKWPDAVNNADNAPVIRTTEIVLNYVEAKAEVDNAVSQDLINRMNTLRTRAGLPGWTLSTFSSKDAFVNAVLNERWKELAFEGHRRMDLLRRGKNLRANDPKAVYKADRTILPIPQREIDNNPALVGQQNPGY
jgi:starch-binding outer membrane protein, SusD/RagB family